MTTQRELTEDIHDGVHELGRQVLVLKRLVLLLLLTGLLVLVAILFPEPVPVLRVVLPGFGILLVVLFIVTLTMAVIQYRRIVKRDRIEEVDEAPEEEAPPGAANECRRTDL